MDGKVAESVFIGGLFVLSSHEMAQICQALKKDELSQNYLDQANEMADTVMREGWDGSWFLRAFDHYGNKIGSGTCDEGKIFIEPQGICIMAGLGLSDGKAIQALEEVNKRLATPHGIILQQPAFSRYYLNLGEISSYPPGYKENAGIFCHTNPWIMIAETLVGHNNLAMDYYLRINPSYREQISELHRCEPYVYPQMIAGRDAPTHGEAKNSWLTGTAAWNYVAITQWILGIRPTLHGLRISPAIPTHWDGFSATRYYRGIKYKISVKRAGKGDQVSIKVDGVPTQGDILPLDFAGKKEVTVDVILR
jgi:cellobiose phosphorylase